MTTETDTPLLSRKVRAQLPADWQATRFAPEATNQLWCLQAGGQRWVWRQFAPPDQTPGVDRVRERVVMQALQTRDWTPDLLVWTPEGMLLPWVKGQSPLELTPDSVQREALIDLLCDLWRQPAPDVIAWDYVGLVRRYAAACPPSAHWQSLAERLENTCLEWPAAAPCLMHHDLHAGNLLLSGQRWTLLDWEYAARGNPWIDAVSVDRWLGFSAAEKARLQPLLAPHAVPGDAWAQYRDWVEGLEALWYAAQGRG